jgi:hypothetical protein
VTGLVGDTGSTLHARDRGWPVITATPGPLFAVAPDVAVEVLP